MTRAGTIALTFLCVMVADSGRPDPLGPNSIGSEKLPGTATLRYALDVPPNQTYALRIIEHQGVAGFVSIVDAKGNVLVEADLRNRSADARKLLIPPGAVLLSIAPPSHSAVERVFDLETGSPHPVTEQDRRRFSAEQLLGHGERVLTDMDPGYLQAALSDYQKSLELWQQLDAGSRRADTLTHIAFAFYQLGQMKPALETYRQALDLFTAANDRSGQAAALYGMALVSGDIGDQKNAVAWANQALIIRQDLGEGAGQPEILIELLAMAYVRGQYVEAQSLGERALTLAAQTGNRLREADANNFLGMLAGHLANRKEAIARYSRALELDREERDPARAAQALSNIGSEYFALGEIDTALRYLREALPLRKTFGNPNNYANTLYNIATAEAGLGRYDQALEKYQQALAIFRGTHSFYGEDFTLREMGNLLMQSGESEKAARYFREAVDLAHATSEHAGEALSLIALGALADSRHDLHEASTYYEEALSIAHASSLRRQEAEALANLASVALRLGNAEAAARQASEAADIAGQTGDRFVEADALKVLGACRRRTGEYDRARTALDRALELNRAGARRPGEAAVLEELARVERDSRRLDEAQRRITEALAATEAIRPAMRTMDARMRFTALHRSRIDLAIDIAMQLGQTAAAFELSEQGHARGLADMLRETGIDIRQGVDPGLLERERALAAALDATEERLSKLLNGPHSPSQEAEARAEVDRAVEQYRAIEAGIRAASPRYAALIEPPAVSIAALQHNLLDPSTALVEYWVGDERSYAWVVSRTAYYGITLPAGRQVEPLARRLYQDLNARNSDHGDTYEQKQARIAEADRDSVRVSAELSRMLLGPLAGRLAQQRLWIVADGALEYVPFAALPLPGDTAPLIAAHELRNLASASVLSEVRREVSARRPAAYSVTVFADPVFRADDERVAHAAQSRPPRAVPTPSGAELSDLPRLYFSRQEAQSIAALGPPEKVRTYLDFDANRAQAEKPSLADFRVVHFATHTFLDNRHPELSGVVLSLVDRNGRPREGVLRLHEIYNLRFLADLVVLSGCETALGEEIRSEGMVGLTRGFMYAGAPQVLASLWAVRDRSTAELMKRFYEGLLRRHWSAGEALRSAQLSMWKDARWSQPYYWAAFTLQGSK